MRKILSLVLVLALVLGAFPVFADNDAMDPMAAAEVLKGYKVLIGNEVGDLMLDEYLTREQSLVVLARLMGMEDEAKATTIAASFKDIPAGSYYAPFIAFAEGKGWTNGIGNSLFGYGQQVKTQEAAAFMLRALGYEVAYEDVMTKAAELGILKGVSSEAGADMLRGQLAVMMYNTLETKPMNSDITLREQLGLGEVAQSGAAVITDVVADNLKQLKVYFSAPVEKAGDEDNWSVNKKASFKITEDAKFALSEDKMMVTITLDSENLAEQQEVVSLTCKDLLAEEVTIDGIQFLDTTIPEVEKVEVIGINTIKVTFSEPMVKASLQNKEHYFVKKADGTKLHISKVTEENYGMVAYVELYSDLAEGDIVVEVKDVNDFQDFNIKQPAIFNLTVVKDTEKPYITGYKDASPYEVTLIWNEDIKFVDDPIKLEKFYHTNTHDTPKSVSIHGNEMTLVFEKTEDEDKLLPAGTAYIYVQDKAVQDYWENQNDDQMFVMEIELDKEPPSIVKYKQLSGQRRLEVEFSENLYHKDKYKISLLKDGKEDDTVLSFDFGGDDVVYGDTLYITFDDDMYGDYSLVFENVQDRAGNKMPKTTLDFVMVDKVRPFAFDEDGKQVFTVTAYNAGWPLKSADVHKDQKILIDFGEKMDVESITDRDNYWLVEPADDLGLGKYKVQSNLENSNIDFEVLDEGEKLLITIPWSWTKKDADRNDLLLEVDDTDNTKILQRLKIGQLKDAAGNRMTTFTALLAIDNGNVKTIESGAELTDGKTVVVTIEDDVRAKLQIGKIELRTTVTTTGPAVVFDNKKFASTKVSLKDGDTVITFKLNDDQVEKLFKSTDPEVAGLQYRIVENSMTNVYGKGVAEVAWTDVEDKAAPEVVEVYYNKDYTTGGAIIVEFTEAIDGSSIAVRGNNGFTDSTKLIPKNVDHTVTVMGNCLVIVENKDGKSFKDTTDLYYDGKNDIQDADGNRVKAFSRTKTLKTEEFPF